MKYMLLFWVDEAAESTGDEDAAMLIAVKSWVEKLTEQGVRVTGGPLRSVAEGRIVRVRDDGLLVSDGPFAETKEQIGGYYLIEAASPAAAQAWAARCPAAGHGMVELREVI